MRDLCEDEDPASELRQAKGEPLGELAASSPTRRPSGATPKSPGCSRPSTCRRSRRPASRSPISMLERVIEERARGDPEAAAAHPRRDRRALVGDDLAQAEAGLARGRAPQGGADRARRLVAIPRGRHRSGRRDLHQGAADVGGRHGAGRRHPSELDLEQPRARDRAGGRLARPHRRRDASATTSTCATSKAARRCCCRKAKDNNASCAIGPFMRLFDAGFSLDDVRRMTVTLTVDGEDGLSARRRVLDAQDQPRPGGSGGPADQRASRYPDGAVLFLGTMFAPVEDRDARARASRTSSATSSPSRRPRLGRLVNRIRHTDQCERVDVRGRGADAEFGEARGDLGENQQRDHAPNHAGYSLQEATLRANGED